MDNHDLSLHDQQFKNTYLKSFSQKKKKKNLTNKTIMLFALRLLNKNMTPLCLYDFFSSFPPLPPSAPTHSLLPPSSSASTQTHYPRLSPSALCPLFFHPLAPLLPPPSWIWPPHYRPTLSSSSPLLSLYIYQTQDTSTTIKVVGDDETNCNDG